MPRGRQLTRLELERIKILAANGMSENKISQKIHRSRSLVHHALQQHQSEVLLTMDAIKEEGVDLYTDIINKSLERLSYEIMDENLKPTDVAKIMSQCFDKRQLLRGSPTSIGENNVTTQDESEAKRLIQAFGEFTSSNDTEGAKGDSQSEPVFIRTNLSAPSSQGKNK